MEAVLVPLGFFAMIAAIVVLPGYIRARSRQRLMETMRVAFERGQPVPPELIDAINTDPKAQGLSPRERAERDLRNGVITLSVALALIAFGWALSYAEADAFFPMVGMAAFPGFIGLALIVFGLLGRNRPQV